MAGFASDQAAARNAFVSVFPFEPSGGGLGISLTCTTTSGTSSRTALVGSGNVLCINNPGSVYAYLALGSSTVVATTAYIGIPPGQVYLTLPNSEQKANETTRPTHAAAITIAGETTLQITLGFGN